MPLGRAGAFTAFGFFFVFGIGVLGQPHMLHKFYMLDDPRKLRWLPLVIAASQSLCLLIWVGVGLAVILAYGRELDLLATGAELARLTGHEDWVRAVALTPAVMELIGAFFSAAVLAFAGALRQAPPVAPASNGSV